MKYSLHYNYYWEKHPSKTTLCLDVCEIFGQLTQHSIEKPTIKSTNLLFFEEIKKSDSFKIIWQNCYLPSAYKVGIGTLGRIAPGIGNSGPHSSGGT